MGMYLPFVISFGATLALQCIIAAWLFRTANAPMWAKIIIPSSILFLAFYTPSRVSELMGYPVTRSAAEMPHDAQLLSIVTDDDELNVDLWMIVDDAEPRGYRTVLTPELKKLLRAAQAELQKGNRVILRKRSDKNGKGENKNGEEGNGSSGSGKNSKDSDALGIGDDDSSYTIDGSALTVLPPKAAE